MPKNISWNETMQDLFNQSWGREKHYPKSIQQGTAIDTELAKVFNKKKKYVYTFKFELKLATNERAVYDKPDQSDLP